MATASLTKGAATVIQGTSTTVSTDSDGAGIYIGKGYSGYANNYDAAVVVYTVPSISDCLYGRSITIPVSLAHSMGTATSLYARLSANAPGSSYSSFVNGPGSGIISNEVAFTHGTTSLAFTITSHGTNLSGQKIYLYLYAKTSISSLYRVYINSIGSATLTYTAPYKLTISAGTGSTVTVNRTASSGGSTGKLSDDASLYYGDKLTITYAAKTGYEISSAKLGSSVISSGAAHTVSGNVSVTVSAALKTFTLSISAGTGSSITVKRGSTALSNGTTITYGDVLTITFAASTGYNLGTHTVNGSNFTSGNTHTVTEAVDVVSTAALKTFALSISAGTGCSVMVNRTKSSGGSTGALSNGATLYYGDTLAISYTAAAGHEIETATLNGADISSGDIHTVVGAVAVVIAAMLMGLARIGDGETTRKYLVYIGNGTEHKQYVPYVGNGTSWDMRS